MQVHHFATNKNSVYTPRLQQIADRYGLGLDEPWNKELLPHLGRHPNAYHEFVTSGMETAAREAGRTRRCSWSSSINTSSSPCSRTRSCWGAVVGDERVLLPASSR